MIFDGLIQRAQFAVRNNVRRLRRAPKTALCAIAKDEAPYVEEWAAFHIAIGFDRIFIYDNDSNDGMADLFASGKWSRFVTVLPWPSVVGQSPQISAYRHFLASVGESFEWVAFFDLDEFLNLKHHERLDDFLAEYADVDAIGFNWRMFGSSGHESATPDLVMNRFDRASSSADGMNHHIKTIARVRAIVEPHIHTPLLRPGSRFVSPNRAPIEVALNSFQPAVDHSIAQLNHYFTKSRDEFVHKVRRGKADDPPETRRYRPEADFPVYDKNDVEDLTIQRWSPAVHRVLSAMQARSPGRANAVSDVEWSFATARSSSNASASNLGD